MHPEGTAAHRVCRKRPHSPLGVVWQQRISLGSGMQAKRLTQEDFAMNHPAGRIGKRLILKVHDVMLTGSSLPLIGPDVLIMEVSASRLQLASLSCCCSMHQGCAL